MAKKYFAFISYKREDEEWAKWFQNELGNYHLPSRITERKDLGGLPKEFRPVFRDIDNLKAGNLPQQIYEALEQSLYLVVICSPKAAKSEWVNKEICDFLEIGKKNGEDNLNHIFPFIIDGVAHSKNEDDECLPEALRELSAEKEIVGGNINEGGDVNKEQSRDRAFVKVLSGMLPKKVTFDMLWNKYEQDKIEEERIERERRDKLLRLQSRFISEKANDLINSGDSYLARRLLLEILPRDGNDPDRRYTVEAEAVLRLANRNECVVLKGHTDGVSHIHFLPVRKHNQLLSLSSDGTIRIWQIDNGKCISVINTYPKKFVSAEYSPDGENVVLASRDGTIELWNVASKKKSDVRFEKMHTGDINHASFSHDGKCIVSASTDGTLRVWSANSGECMDVLKGHKAGVIICTAVFSYDDNIIISGSMDGTARIWRRGGESKRYKAVEPSLIQTAAVTSATMSRNQKWVAISSLEKIILLKLNEISNQYEERERIIVSDKSKWVHCVRFSPDGHYLVSGSMDGFVNLWDVSGKKSIHVKTFEGHTRGVMWVDFSPDGKRIASGSLDGTIRMWNVPNTMESVQTIKGHTMFVKFANFSPDGERIVSYSSEVSGDGMIRVFDTVGVEIKSWKTGDERFSSAFICYSPETEMWIVWTQSKNFMNGVLTNRYWNADTGELLDTETEMFKSIQQISPDKMRRIISYRSGSQHLEDIQGNELKSPVVLEEGRGITTYACFSPDGKYVASASTSPGNPVINVRNAKTGEFLRTLTGHTDSIWSISFSPDSGCIISASADGSIRIWDVLSGVCLQTFRGHEGDVSSAFFSLNGRQIISAGWDKTIRIWNFPPLQELIDQTRERFKDYPLTPEDRRKYYLE